MKDPNSISIIEWFQAGTFAVLGGFVSWYENFRKKNSKVVKIYEIVCEHICAYVIGSGSWILAINHFNYSHNLGLFFAICGGMLGKRSIEILNAYVDKQIKRINTKDSD